MSTDINKVAVYDDRVIQTAPSFAVQKGALSLTNAPFRAISQSSNQHTYNINVPSEQVFVDRGINWTSSCFFQCTVDIEGETPGAPPVVQIAKDVALPAFPLHSLVTTMTATINDATTTINLMDCMYEILRLTDLKKNRAQRTCPTQLDKFQEHKHQNGTINNNLAGYAEALDIELVPNGAFPDLQFTDEKGVVLTGNGTYTYNATTVTYTDGIPRRAAGTAGATLSYPIFFKFTSTEKIILSPFIFSDIHENDTGLYGVQNINFVMTLSQPKRLLRNANPDIIIRDIVYNDSHTNGAFENSVINVEFLTPSLSVPLPPRSIVPYMEFPRYITSNLTVKASDTRAQLTSNTIVLNSIPDMFIIYVKPTTYANTEADYYLSPNRISINFDNFAGVLSSHTKEQLYSMSFINGLEMDYAAWRGKAYMTGATSTELTNLVGGFLVLRPGKDIPLQEGQAPGLLGSFSFQCDLTVENNQNKDLAVNMYIVAVNSGFFESQNGSSRIVKSVLNEADVINANDTSNTNASVGRMVGAGFFKNIGSKLSTFFKNHPRLFNFAKDYAKEEIKKRGKLGEAVVGELEKRGYGQTGAGSTGAGQTGAGKRGRPQKALLSRLM